eukprot:2360225-Rhodomonas_salina.2
MKGGGACQAVNGCKRCDANPLPNAYLYLAFQPPILRVVYAPPSSECSATAQRGARLAVTPRMCLDPPKTTAGLPTEVPATPTRTTGCAYTAVKNWARAKRVGASPGQTGEVPDSELCTLHPP